MASYFLGVRAGKSQESGNDYYVCNLLICNTYGNWGSHEYFIQAPLYGRICKASYPIGSAVIPVFDGTGKKPTLKRLTPDVESDSIVLVPDDDWDDD